MGMVLVSTVKSFAIMILPGIFNLIIVKDSRAVTIRVGVKSSRFGRLQDRAYRSEMRGLNVILTTRRFKAKLRSRRC